MLFLSKSLRSQATFHDFSSPLKLELETIVSKAQREESTVKIGKIP